MVIKALNITLIMLEANYHPLDVFDKAMSLLVSSSKPVFS